MTAVIRASSFFSRWVADVLRQPALMLILVVAPFLLVAWNRAHHRYLPPRRLELLELFVVLAVLAGVALFAVTADVSLLFVALPFIGWTPLWTPEHRSKEQRWPYLLDSSSTVRGYGCRTIAVV